MTLAKEEPAAGPWRIAPLSELVAVLLDAGVPHVGRPRIVALDGRSGSGKTTLAERVRTVVPGVEVVHTDDIAWWHSRFGWHDLMIDGVLDNLHRGQSVHYQPPARASRRGAGPIDVSAKALVVIIEGVAAARRELTHLLDAVVWVQSDVAEAKRRGILRGRGGTQARERWDAWMTEEIPFLAADRPWERATVIVAGTAESRGRTPVRGTSGGARITALQWLRLDVAGATSVGGSVGSLFCPATKHRSTSRVVAAIARGGRPRGSGGRGQRALHHGGGPPENGNIRLCARPQRGSRDRSAARAASVRVRRRSIGLLDGARRGQRGSGWQPGRSE